MLAENIEIAARPIEADGERAHQRQIATLHGQLIPHTGGEQGMGRALARVAVGQIVEAAPVRTGSGGGRWKNCGRGRSFVSAESAEISQQGSPW